MSCLAIRSYSLLQEGCALLNDPGPEFMGDCRVEACEFHVTSLVAMGHDCPVPCEVTVASIRLKIISLSSTTAYGMS